MRISIRQLKQIIKEQVEEDWSDKEVSGRRGPKLDLSKGRESQRGGWTDRDRNPKIEDLKQKINDEALKGGPRAARKVSELIDELIAELEQ